MQHNPKVARGGVFRFAKRRAERRPPMVAGMIVATIAALLGFSVVLSAWSRVPEVTRAPGEIKPTDDFRQVEAPEFGTVSRVLVREGDFVERGDVLAVLSSTELERRLKSVNEELAALSARAQNHDFILKVLSEGFVETSAIPKREDLEYAASKLSVLAAQQATDQDVLEQLEASLLKQTAALARLQKRRVEKQKQVRDAESLYERRLTTRGALIAKQDGLAQIEDQLHSLELAMSDRQKEIEVLRAKMSQDRLRAREQHVDALFSVSEEQRLLRVERQTLQARSATLQILAPEPGQVHSVSPLSNGELIEQGESLFELLPTGDALVAVLRLSTRDIGHVQPGMAVAVKLDTFDARTTEALSGTIISVSPNRIFDRDLGEDYFRTTVKLDAGTEAYKAVAKKLRSGMAVTAEVTTRDRSMLTYLLRPIERSLDVAFSER